MADDSVTTPVVNDCDPAVVDTATDEMKLLGEAVKELPAHAVKDLMTQEHFYFTYASDGVDHFHVLQVCVRCIFRLFDVQEGIYALVSPTTLYSIIGKGTQVEAMATKSSGETEDVKILHSSQESEKSSVCSVCLGALQFSYCDERDVLVEKDHAEDFARTVAESVKEKCHEIASYSLEVSLPTVINENEEVIVSYMKKKYASEVWFQEKFSSEHISVKDALKLSITHSLELLLGVKCGVSDFRIRLTYEHLGATSAEDKAGKNQCNKRQKSGMCAEVSSFHSSEGNGLIKCSNGTTQSGDVSDFSCQLRKVGQPCRMTLLCSRAPIYIGGRYLKFSRNVSQTRWIIDDERKGEASVEELIGGNILPMCNGDGYKFHAAGREDIDVRMLGSGRPFLIEIQNARNIPSEMSIKEMEKKINSLESNLKEYAALVWISRPIKEDDLQAVSSFKDLKVLQRTPVRVLHRRSPLEREKIIHWMKIEEIAGNSQYFLLHLCTQAGTYIKEFVHGDLGRTHPSIGSILGCRAEILQLDVTDVKMDILNE
ncbi:Pseudouridine synthase, catalytic domain-containing protein [Cynara cardunculus var. scolymus]|uniref:tRNA pseudouridine(55) synthase n=1 Tax=Cynara cardunculus var. scolymus TaxID=59895 RepID=A0A103YEP9_CYNCS|nr:Pseudouridine synthase, catalytic domain-containing protein [Cynara cardunculus var. scolymus]